MDESFYITSPIQNNIISLLKNARALRFSDLQGDVPNDLFNYHLQFLVKKGFIEKSDDLYGLSASGKKYVADFHPATDSFAGNLFKVNVLTVLSRIKDKKIEILNQIRMSNPSYGKTGVMGGVVHKSEPIEAAAKRKLKEETGLEANFKMVGIERRMMYVDDKLFSDVLFPIAYADEYEGELMAETKFGKNKWVAIDEAIANEKGEFDHIESLQEVLEAIKNGRILKLPFFYKESVQKGKQI